MASRSLPVCRVRIGDIPDHPIDSNRLIDQPKLRPHKLIGGELEDFLGSFMFV